MPNYRRIPPGNRPIFITLVTYQRRPILVEYRAAFRVALNRTRKRLPFELRAIVLLPDHCHLIMQLPEDESDFSVRINQVKGRFSRALPALDETNSHSRRKRRERAVWQRRFWDHVIRSEEEIARHLDYIHFNAVKHGYVERCRDWRWSSFHRFVSEGYYDIDWGGG